MSHVPTKRIPAGFRSPLSLTGLPRADVLLALSGGADSVCLLSCLLEDAKRRGYRVLAAHVHHGIRGAEADADEAFCRALCQGLDVPFFCHRADVPALARKRGQNLEECARDTRYEFFRELMEKENLAILATAHHADDQLETLLLHLARGTSGDGLCGIRPVRPFGNGFLTRPLLEISRAEILDYCKEMALPFVTDSTNADTSYARNRLRADVSPVLHDLNPRLSEAVTRLCADLSRDADFFKNQTEEFLSRYGTQDGIELEALKAAHPALASRVICQEFLEASGGIALSHHQVEAILALLMSSDPYASYDLPAHLCASKREGRLVFGKRQKNEDAPCYEQILHEGFNVLSHTGFEIFMSPSLCPKNIYKNSIRMCLFADTIKGKIYVRPRRAGDVILCGGMHKDVRKLMSAKRVPLALRKSLPLLCDEDGILAIPSVAIRDGARAKDGTQNTVVIEIKL